MELIERDLDVQRREEKRRRSAEKETARSERAETLRLEELKALDEIEASGWKPKIDHQAVFTSSPSDASLLPLPELKPYINASLSKVSKAATSGQRKHYHQLKEGELLRYFLYICVKALQRYQRHRLSQDRLSRALAHLMATNRFSALRARFSVEANCLSAILASWTPHIIRFIQAGSVSIVDEGIFPHWGKKANEQRLLQQIPGKPHDFGLVAYFLVQRLHSNDQPVVLGLLINHLGRTLTPTDCAIELHTALINADPTGPPQRHLVIDSAWSAAGSLRQFELRGVQYCVSLKGDSKIIPAPLYEVSSSDLPLFRARTYTNGELVLEVVKTGAHVMRLLTNMFITEGRLLPLDTRIGTYTEAVHLFDKQSPEILTRMFQLNPEWALRTAEDIIHHHLGWDVLRPDNDQEGSNPLTYTAVKGMKVSQIRAIRQQLLPNARQSSGTKEKMLDELFPEEQRKADATAAGSQGRARKRRGQERLSELELIRGRVRGGHSMQTPIRDFYDTYYNAVDRMNQDYHSHFQLRNWPSGPQWALHSALFYFFNSTRSIWEEHMVSHLCAQHGGQMQPEALPALLTIPEFVLNCVESLDPRM